MKPTSLRRFLLFSSALGVAVACGRSGLDSGDFEWLEGQSALPEAGVGGTHAKPDGAACVPSEEICNGVDDDCDGDVDEVPPVACPGGGEQYCVGGAMSACPERCEACMPGSERICFVSFCKHWGVQTCTADGKSFGKCKEEDPPPECAAVAEDEKYSKAVEQCCLDAGYCCRDTFDLDGDGDTGDMLGECEEVLCKP